ncbi:MAG: hypothetical protein V3U87_05755 [Methylococcaceae bacterium]
MKFLFKISSDEYGRKTLFSEMNFEVDVKIMAFAWYKDKVWWSKTSDWNNNIDMNIMYHHCKNSDRQVQVRVSRSAFIQDCTIPNGYDPESGNEINVEYLTPIVIYNKEQHGIGFIVFPDGSLKSLRNGIWKLKREFYTNNLQFFEPALSKTRKGSMLGFKQERLNLCGTILTKRSS